MTILVIGGTEFSRLGDGAQCQADIGNASRTLGWKSHRGIDEMCADTWNWQSKNPRGLE